MNVGRKLVDDSACDAVLDSVQAMAADWAVLFLAECDARMEDSHQLNFGDHFSKRFWPRVGSRPFSVVVRDCKAYCLRSVVQRGRACRIHIADAVSLDISFVFMHGGHGEEFAIGFSDAASS